MSMKILSENPLADPAPGRQVWAHFLAPLEKPFKVSQGATVPLSHAVFDELRSSPGGEAVLNVTPQAVAYALAGAGRVRAYRPMSALVKYGCGTCALRPGAQFTVCEECGGSRFVWLPQFVTQRRTQEAVLRVRLAAQLSDAWRRGEYLDCETVEAWQRRLAQEAELNAAARDVKRDRR